MYNQSIKYHLDKFYGDNPEFGEDGGIHEKWAWLEFGFFKIPFPNFKSRSDIIYLHDVNHIINDYDTTWKGEVSVSAWEISTGMGRFLTGWLFASFAFGFGILTYPKSVYRAFMKGRITKSLFKMEIPKEELLNMSLKEVKQITNHEEKVNYQPTTSDKLRFVLAGSLSCLFFLSPFIISILLLITL
ncbi:hypothetical protein [Flammeovirga sp. SubArs3]|uniref:hypothetical protein n=1 Tax=Flammeovirga sp. SubArs3 TaxID=2995316 RepID=UPI00248C3D91|nr:hypothetical protein [Flammeovirga sp. SubArs3]